MYCPVCGAESTPGLNYCKRCGTSLNSPTNPLRASDSAPPPRMTGAAWAIAFATVVVTLGGLGIIFSSAYELIRPYPGSTPVAGAPTVAGLMVAFGSATVLGVVALLIQLFSRLLGVRTESPDMVNKPQRVVGEYKPAQIHPAPSGIPSVTEQTTRNFDPALYRDRQQ